MDTQHTPQLCHIFVWRRRHRSRQSCAHSTSCCCCCRQLTPRSPTAAGGQVVRFLYIDHYSAFFLLFLWSFFSLSWGLLTLKSRKNSTCHWSSVCPGSDEEDCGPGEESIMKIRRMRRCCPWPDVSNLLNWPVGRGKSGFGLWSHQAVMSKKQIYKWTQKITRILGSKFFYGLWLYVTRWTCV